MSVDPWATSRARCQVNGAHIRQTRQPHFTLSEFAAAVGCDVPTMSRIEKGTMIPDAATAARITHLIGTDPRLQIDLSGERAHIGETGPELVMLGNNASGSTVIDPPFNFVSDEWMKRAAASVIRGPGHARMGDPRSSEDTVRSIDADTRLHDLIMWAAGQHGDCTIQGDRTGQDERSLFDDTDLLNRIEDWTGRRFQRNVIARARGRLERGGRIERFGPVERDDRDRDNIHYYTLEN